MIEPLFCVVRINGIGEIGTWQVISAFVAAIMASSKGRSALIWFFVGLFTPCCIGPILVALLPDLTTPEFTAQPPIPQAPAVATGAGTAVETPPSPADLVPRWFYEEAGEPAGPISTQSLRALLQSGSIDGETLVWCEGMPDWAPYDASEARTQG